MSALAKNAPGKEVLLMGNEAMARGAIEAGVRVAAAYPGNPSSEIVGSLAQVGPELGIHVEWSANEKVALEVAAAASFAGLRGLAAMKQNGLNVAADFLFNLNLSGTKGGMVLIVCDDPGAISSTNEEDTRLFARIGDLPLLEPGDAQEAKEMTRWAFLLSEELGLPCLIRSVTRISHSRGGVILGEIPGNEDRAWFDASRPFISMPALANHSLLHQKMEKCREIFETSPFNFYEGPERAEALIVTSGTGWAYAREALTLLGATARVGILKLGATWPLVTGLLTENLKRAPVIIFIEEVDPFLEVQVKAFWAQQAEELEPKRFFGRASGHLPQVGEMNSNLVLTLLQEILDVKYEARPADYLRRAEAASALAPARQVGFCAGCPHRATYWAIKNALALDGREGFVTGDIGCYGMGFGPSGFGQVKTLHAMGSGPGLASGLGQLRRFGLDQPVLTVCGDSTFYHAALPALINARYNGASFLMLVLDNSATAMTGFQPHPGTGRTAGGDQASMVEIEAICRAIGFPVEVIDPFEVDVAIEAVFRLIQDRDGVKILIMRQTCALVRAKAEKASFRVRVDPERCLGEACGCDRLCTRIFKCPGLIWDGGAGKARVDEVICNACGVCVQICPQSAIVKEDL